MPAGSNLFPAHLANQLLAKKRISPTLHSNLLHQGFTAGYWSYLVYSEVTALLKRLKATKEGDTEQLKELRADLEYIVKIHKGNKVSKYGRQVKAAKSFLK